MKESIKSRDPVGGMMVSTDDALSFEYKGHDYYFCSEGCEKNLVQSQYSMSLPSRSPRALRQTVR